MGGAFTCSGIARGAGVRMTSRLVEAGVALLASDEGRVGEPSLEGERVPARAREADAVLIDALDELRGRVPARFAEDGLGHESSSGRWRRRCGPRRLPARHRVRRLTARKPGALIIHSKLYLSRSAAASMGARRALVCVR